MSDHTMFHMHSLEIGRMDWGWIFMMVFFFPLFLFLYFWQHMDNFMVHLSWLSDPKTISVAKIDIKE